MCFTAFFLFVNTAVIFVVAMLLILESKVIYASDLFPSFWQMIELADIARCVADTDFSKEGSEFLLACMHDLQDVLQHSKLKALVIDTFGSRIEKLLRQV